MTSEGTVEFTPNVPAPSSASTQKSQPSPMDSSEMPLDPYVDPLRKHLIQIKEQQFGDFKTAIDTELEEAIQKKEVQFVYQRGIGFADGNNPQTRFIETSNYGEDDPYFGSCVILTPWSPVTMIGCVVHIDAGTDLLTAKTLINERLGNQPIQMSVIGGQTDVSELTLQQMNEVFGDMKNIVVTRGDILGPKSAKLRQVVLDCQTGDVYNLQGDNRKNMKPWTSFTVPPEIESRRKKGQAQEGIILDVDIVNKPDRN